MFSILIVIIITIENMKLKMNLRISFGYYYFVIKQLFKCLLFVGFLQSKPYIIFISKFGT